MVIHRIKNNYGGRYRKISAFTIAIWIHLRRKIFKKMKKADYLMYLNYKNTKWNKNYDAL